jgi:hypothetical protein
MLTANFATGRARSKAVSSRVVRLVLVIAVAVAVVACRAVAQVNIVFEVYNQTSHTGSYAWQGPGGSGSGSIAPCRTANTAIGLGPGTWQVTITEGGNSKTYAITSPPTGSAYEYFAIRPDGQIEHLYRWLDLQSPPQSPQPPPSGC